MAILTCIRCHCTWDGSKTALCPACLEHNWENTQGFIKPKHDPRNLPSYYNTYRSVVTMDFIVNESMYLHELAYFSDLYLDTKYNNFTCILNQPLGTTAGSAIPANFPWPSYPLDSQKVVNIHGDPHVYAVDQVDVNFEISTGRLIASQVCDVTGCRNLAIPGTTKCSRH